MLVQLNDITKLLNKALGQMAKCKKDGTQLLYKCPFHVQQSIVPKLEVCLHDNSFGVWHCWACNAKGGSLANLLRKLKCNKNILSELFSILKDTPYKKRVYTTKKTNNDILLPDEFKPLSIVTNDVLYKHVFSYVKNRGLTRDDILRYNIGYCNGGEYNNRVLIPSYDENGNLNYFVTRTIFEDTGFMKYKNCPYSKNIIGFESFVNWDEPITLVEGVFDAISIRRNAIPLFGKIMSSKLKEKLVESGTISVNICLDNDALADSLRISKYLSDQGINVHLIQTSGKDPSSMGFEKTLKLLTNPPTFGFSELIKLKMNMGNMV